MKLTPHLAPHEYHQHPAVSKHGLDAFRKAPALYQFVRNNPLPPTPSMRFGSLYHTAMLEPEKLATDYFVMPDVDRRTKDGKAAWEAALIECGTREQVKTDDLQKTSAMFTALMKHTAAANAITQLREYVEASLFWTDPTTGVECRARPDLIRNDGFIVDLKTAADASADAFQRASFNYGYHRQAAFYLDAWKLISGEAPKGFIFVVQETEAPFLTAVYVASPAMIEAGRAEITQDLQGFAKCLETNNWPGLPEAPQELTLPRWAMPAVA
jgi:exodeoxyribonuclease VIII